MSSFGLFHLAARPPQLTRWCVCREVERSVGAARHGGGGGGVGGGGVCGAAGVWGRGCGPGARGGKGACYSGGRGKRGLWVVVGGRGGGGEVVAVDPANATLNGISNYLAGR